MAEHLLAVVPVGAPLPFGVVFRLKPLLRFVTGELAVASVVTRVLVTFAADAGLPIIAVTLTEAVALQVPFFTHQSAVLVVIPAYRIVETRDLIPVVAAVTLTTVSLLVPVQFGI